MFFGPSTTISYTNVPRNEFFFLVAQCDRKGIIETGSSKIINNVYSVLDPTSGKGISVVTEFIFEVN